VVFKFYQRDGKVVAVKAISLLRLNRKLIDGLRGEVAIMKEIRHSNVVELFDIYVRQYFVGIVRKSLIIDVTGDCQLRLHYNGIL
jgi:hypothetical protein